MTPQDIFETKVKTSNPSFTKGSLKRTLEACIIESKKLSPLAVIPEEELDELMELTITSWDGRVRLDLDEIKEQKAQNAK